MQRRGLAWLLALPLVTAGSLSAHALAYRIAEPEPDARATLLDTTGHGYLAATPFFLAVGIAFVAAGLLTVASRAGRGASTAPATWPLALVAPIGFAAQEHLERLAADGSFPLDLALEPTFLTGLALQLPFALVAVLAARWLGRGAEAVGRALGRLPTAARRPARACPPLAATVFMPRPAPASVHSGRGPPGSS
jgi:hypothetical protein